MVIVGWAIAWEQSAMNAESSICFMEIFCVLMKASKTLIKIEWRYCSEIGWLSTEIFKQVAPKVKFFDEIFAPSL